MGFLGVIRILFKIAILFVLLLVEHGNLSAQFYTGHNLKFGKNRIQYDDFMWKYYKFSRFNVYFYEGGTDLAIYTAKTAKKSMEDVEIKFDYYLREKERMYFIVYNNISHYRQSNIGINDNEENNIGGITRMAENKVFLYFNGDHRDLDVQIKEGVSSMVVNRMMYGSNWKELVKNSTLLSLPDWYLNGLVSYSSDPDNLEVEEFLRDNMDGNGMSKFNRLTGKEAKLAGHALWNYIGEMYGTNVIPNILYMSRISRNVESGFLFVLGASLRTIMLEAEGYYQRKWESNGEDQSIPDKEEWLTKTRKNRIYSRPSMSPDGRYLAYSTNQQGKVKVYIRDLKEEKTRMIWKTGHKLDREEDNSYPVMTWHPKGNNLAVFREFRGRIFLDIHDVEKEEIHSKEIFRIQKITSADYAPSGSRIIFCGVHDGQSDIYEYRITGNTHEKLTNDVFDDYEPKYIRNGKEIAFISNRLNDTLNPKVLNIDERNQKTDIFGLQMERKSNLLKRYTKTENIEERLPLSYGSTDFVFLSNDNGVFNRFVASYDSTISFVDTAIHYSYFTKTAAISNYKRSIINHQLFDEKNGVELFKYDGKYRLSKLSIDPSKTYEIKKPFESSSSVIIEEKTSFEAKNETLENSSNETTQHSTSSSENIKYKKVDVFKTPEKQRVNSQDKIDIDNYTFDAEVENGKNDTDDRISKIGGNNDSKNLGKVSGDSINNKPEFELPNQRNYMLNFSSSDIITQFDFDFANQIYQKFNGGPYNNPGMGTVAKIRLNDMFEDQEIEGGVRYAFNNKNTEFFFSYENRLSRMDKKYSYQRQMLTGFDGFYRTRQQIDNLKYIFKWPFSEVSALRTTLNYRHDNLIYLSEDVGSLRKNNHVVNWAGLKTEYIFDNIRNRGLNIYYGTRLKVFGEHYRMASDSENPASTLSQMANQFSSNKTEISVVGVDIRHYEKIHRVLIFATRFAASTSFGSKKLVYYMGSVDNWIANPENKFNRKTQVAMDQDFYWQTLATPMRGFQQNIRNGNSFVVLNNELRWPIFRYMMNKPLKSDFLANFQVIGFADVGTAWTGRDPYSDDNTFNTHTIVDGPLTITIKNQKDPFIGGYGFGLRSRLWGYFIRLDHAWGVEDGITLNPRTYLSLGLDF